MFGIESNVLSALSPGAIGAILAISGSGLPAWTTPGATHTLGAHTDTTFTALSTNHVVKWSGTGWVNGFVGWSEVTGKPSVFPPDTHVHAASDITSGTLAAARGGLGFAVSAQGAVPVSPDASSWTQLAPVDAGTYFLKVSANVITWAADVGNADTLDGQHGSYYLSRANHTGTQAVSTLAFGPDDTFLKSNASAVAWAAITAADIGSGTFQTGDFVMNGKLTATYITLLGSSTVFQVNNATVFAAKNATGSYESFLWPRWSDDKMYLNFGSAGWVIRTSASGVVQTWDAAGNITHGANFNITGSSFTLKMGTFSDASGLIGSVVWNIDGSSWTQLQPPATGVYFLKSDARALSWTTTVGDADTLDGQHGSYYQNASNINAGSLGLAYLGGAAPQGILRVNTAGTGWEVHQGTTLGRVLKLLSGATNAVWGEGQVDWSELTGKPSVFPPDTHVHAAGDITSGTLAAARGGLGFAVSAQGAVVVSPDASSWTQLAPLDTGTYFLKVSANVVSWASAVGDADTLDGQHGTYYLALANATGTLAVTKIVAGADGTFLKTEGTTVLWDVVAAADVDIGTFTAGVWKFGEASTLGFTPNSRTGLIVNRDATLGSWINIVGPSTGTAEAELVMSRANSEARGRVRYELNNDIMELWTASTTRVSLDSTALSSTVPILPTSSGIDLGSTTYKWDLVAQHAYSPMQSVTVASGDTTKTVDLSLGNVAKVTMSNTSSCAFTFSNTQDGGCYTVMLLASGGSRSFTFSTTIEWFGTAPTSPLASGKMLVLTLLDGGGTGLYGFASEQTTVTS